MVAACTLMVTGAVHAKQPAKEPNLVQVAIELNDAGAFEGEFSTLIMLVANDAEILNVLTSNGQRTVFAPTNTAFDNLIAAATENCLELTPGLINSVLKYHVANGRRNSNAVVGSNQIRTLLGASFDPSGGVITDGAGQYATIIATDVPASNGLIHAIDTVLLPFPVTNQCK